MTIAQAPYSKETGPSFLTVGVISDTHGLLRPEAVEALSGVNHILHAGDVGDPAILDVLSSIAPLTAIRGNVDISGRCSQLPATEMVELGGCHIYVIHAIEDLDIEPRSAGVAIVIYGHSHKPSYEERSGTLYLNPGSAGPRRFDLPVTVARLSIGEGKVDARIIPL
ncbi:MAG TPA: metallophosphoesterase family protein [Acidobacteriaceae bacterium]|nr:metallophosphoesterase family protein [Acidobacteriaceae bacterium]